MSTHVYKCGCGAELKMPPTRKHLDSGAHFAWESRTAATSKGHNYYVSSGASSGPGYLKRFKMLARLWPHLISCIYTYKPGFRHRRAQESEMIHVGSEDAKATLYALKGRRTVAPLPEGVFELSMSRALKLHEIYGDQCAETVVAALLSGEVESVAGMLYVNGMISAPTKDYVFAALAHIGCYLLEAIELNEQEGKHG